MPWALWAGEQPCWMEVGAVCWVTGVRDTIAASSFNTQEADVWSIPDRNSSSPIALCVAKWEWLRMGLCNLRTKKVCLSLYILWHSFSDCASCHITECGHHKNLVILFWMQNHPKLIHDQLVITWGSSGSVTCVLSFCLTAALVLSTHHESFALLIPSGHATPITEACRLRLQTVSA